MISIIERRYALLAAVVTLAVAASACTPSGLGVSSPSPSEVSPSGSPPPVATGTPVVIQPTVSRPTSTAGGPAPAIRAEPTFTPYPGELRTSVDKLPLGQPGHYVNVTFGYWLQYPWQWYTGFGNRPLLASFSNLNPATHDRASMRAEGCLIQVSAVTNVYGPLLQELMEEGSATFPHGRTIELDGESGVLIPPGSREDPVQSETVMISHDDVMFVITLDYARDEGEVCRPAWENLLKTWRWIAPEFAVYRNTEYAYAISYPRHWYRFNAHERGISISNRDPTGMTNRVAFLEEAMVVETSVFENPEDLTLKEWLAQKDWDMDYSNDIPLHGGLIGVRAVGAGPKPGIRRMSGYFQGPEGEVYGVLCCYPEDREWEFRSIANAIIYSFSF